MTWTLPFFEAITAKEERLMLSVLIRRLESLKAVFAIIFRIIFINKKKHNSSLDENAHFRDGQVD